MAYFVILCFLTVILWQFYVVAGWNIQESLKNLLETLENSDEYDIVFPLVMTPETNNLVPRVKRNIDGGEVQPEYTTHFKGYDSDSPTFRSGNDVEVPTDNESKKDVISITNSAKTSKTDSNRERVSSNTNKNTYITLEKRNVQEEATIRVENVPNDRTTYFDEKINDESTDMGANWNKPDDITTISLKNWILEVKTNHLLIIQDGLEAEWVTKGNTESVETHGGCKLQIGFVRGDINSTVALTTCDTSTENSETGDMTGLIQVNGDSYFIQPLLLTGELNRQHPHLVYKAKTSLELGNDQDFGDKCKRSGRNSSQRTTPGVRNDSGGIGKVVPVCLGRSKRESYWRHNMTEMKFSNTTARENISFPENEPDVHPVGQPDESLEHTIEHIRRKFEREEQVGYFLDSGHETEGKEHGIPTKLCGHFL